MLITRLPSGHSVKLNIIYLFLFGLLLLFYYSLNNTLGRYSLKYKILHRNVTINFQELVNRRYWELYHNYSSVSTNNLDFEPVLDIYNNSIPRNLWGSRRSFTKTWVHGYDRVLDQLLLLKEDFRHTRIGNFTKKKILLSSMMSWWITDHTHPEHLLQACPMFEDKCEFIFNNSQKIPVNTSEDISAAVINGFSRKLVERPAYSDNVLVFFYTLESNFVSNVHLRKNNDLLASYWSGSDIVASYGKWSYFDPAVRIHVSGRNFATGKTKLVATFVSNCRPINARNDYVSQLKAHIQVDVFGKCGELQCSRSSGSTCYQKLKKEYKFYLAFENANCRDYITEKFWYNALGNDVVPIVMGAHPDDYKAVSPQNSYIHVEDFQNPRALAQHLLYLDAHDEEYNKYFAWKGTGRIVFQPFLCRVCAMTHYADLVPPPARTQVSNWSNISHNHLCLPRGQNYWTSSQVKPK